MLKILQALPLQKNPALQASEEGLKSGSLAVAFVPEKSLLSSDVPQVSPLGTVFVNCSSQTMSAWLSKVVVLSAQFLYESKCCILIILYFTSTPFKNHVEQEMRLK